MVSVHTVTERKTPRHVWQEFKYAFYLIVHPFKGFWEIKHENKGNVKMATAFLLLYLLLSVLSGFYTGYLFNSGPVCLTEKEILKIFIKRPDML